VDYRQNRNYIRSATYSFITLLFLVTNAFAVTSPDVVVDYENDSLAVLNDNFRKLRKGIESAESSISSINTVPAGVIVMWSGAITAIPSGWAICDGNNGTPNLTDRFIIHADSDAGGTRDVGDSGGANTTTIAEANLPAHVHTMVHDHAVNCDNAASVATTPAGNVMGPASDTVYDPAPDGSSVMDSEMIADYTGNTGSVGSGTAVSTIPKFYALAMIMKL